MTRPPRPTLITVFGILNLVAGGIGILFFGISALSLPLAEQMGSMFQFPGTEPMPNPITILEERVPGYRTAIYCGYAMGIVLTALLLASGAGLLGMRRWAWQAALAYGVLMTLAQGWGAYYHLTVIQPHMGEYFEAQEKWARSLTRGRGGPMPSTKPSETMSSLMSLLMPSVLITHALVVAGFMLHPTARAAFTKTPRPAAPPPTPRRDGDDIPWVVRADDGEERHAPPA